MDKLNHNPMDGSLKVIGFMSGSGTNLINIIKKGFELEKEKGKLVYEVVAIFTDNSYSRAFKIGKMFDIPVIYRDINSFYSSRNIDKRDMETRIEYDNCTVQLLKSFKANIIIFCGYMSIVTGPLINNYIGINVHPADLSIEVNGKRKYIGGMAIRDTIIAGEKYIRSTTHIVSQFVDQGQILMISSPVRVMNCKKLEGDYNENDRLRHKVLYNLNRLKKKGDHVVFPKTLEYISEGRFYLSENGKILFDGKEIPNGLKL